MLQACNISVRHHESAPLSLINVSLTLKPGELIAVVGSNGSGKSTLLRALSRTLKPVSGDILLDEKNLYLEFTQNESARKIAVVPQSTDVFLDFTVHEIVAMGRAPYRKGMIFNQSETAEDTRIIDDALTQMGIDRKLASQPISQISGGERQRALIARMLTQQAEYLLLDEPTASLDIRNEILLLNWIKRLVTEQSKAAMVIVHDLNIASDFADRIIMLNGGRIVSAGTPAQAITSTSIAETYGAETWVRQNPVTTHPMVIPIGLVQATKPENKVRESVHLLCGGGSGSKLMLELNRKGYNLTSGILRSGDPDQEVAEFLDIPYIQCGQFAKPSPDDLEKAKALIASADRVILCDVELGEVNRETLQSAQHAEDYCKNLIVVGTRNQTHFKSNQRTIFVNSSESLEELLETGT